MFKLLIRSCLLCCKKKKTNHKTLFQNHKTWHVRQNKTDLLARPRISHRKTSQTTSTNFIKNSAGEKPSNILSGQLLCELLSVDCAGAKGWHFPCQRHSFKVERERESCYRICMIIQPFELSTVQSARVGASSDLVPSPFLT